MTHFDITLLLPLKFNPRKGKTIGKSIPGKIFRQTYKEILGLFGGLSTRNEPPDSVLFDEGRVNDDKR